VCLGTGWESCVRVCHFGSTAKSKVAGSLRTSLCYSGWRRPYSLFLSSSSEILSETEDLELIYVQCDRMMTESANIEIVGRKKRERRRQQEAEEVFVSCGTSSIVLEYCFRRQSQSVLFGDRMDAKSFFSSPLPFSFSFQSTSSSWYLQVLKDNPVPGERCRYTAIEMNFNFP
jgi:hypothetical protein